LLAIRQRRAHRQRRAASVTIREQWPLLLGVLGAVLATPTLVVPLTEDDPVLLAALEGDTPCSASWVDLWRFYSGTPHQIEDMVASGRLPWWTWNGARFALWRPLSSVVLAGVHAVLGRHTAAYHALMVAGYALLIVLVAYLLRRYLPTHLALPAVAIYAAAGVHCEAVAWISTCHLLLGALLGVAALLAFASRRPAVQATTTLWVALSLLAGEVGLQCLALMISLGLVGSHEEWKARIRRLLLPCLCAGVYLIAYRARGAGVRGANDGTFGYVDPIAEPLLTLAFAPKKLTRWMADLLIGLPHGLGACGAPHWFGIVSTSVVGLAFLFALANTPHTLPAEIRRAVSALSLGCGLSLIPILGAEALAVRVLLVPGIAASAICAVVLCRALTALRIRERSWRESFLIVSGIAVATGLTLDVVTWSVHVREACHVGSAWIAALKTSLGSRPRDVVVLVATGEETAIWANTLRSLYGEPKVDHWWGLAYSNDDSNGFSLLRTDAQSFELRGPFYMSYYRDPLREPIVPNARVALDGGVQVEVLETDRGRPTAIRVTLDRPLDDPSLTFLTRDGSGLRPVTMPPAGLATSL
jgi:hypothetical protein